MYIVLVWTLNFVHAEDGSLTWLKGWAGNDSIVSLSPVGMCCLGYSLPPYCMFKFPP